MNVCALSLVAASLRPCVATESRVRSEVRVGRRYFPSLFLEMP